MKGAHLLRRYMQRDYTYYWDDKHIYSKLMYQEDVCPTLASQISQVVDYLVQMPHNSPILDVLTDYCRYLYSVLCSDGGEKEREFSELLSDTMCGSVRENLSTKRYMRAYTDSEPSWMRRLKGRGAYLFSSSVELKFNCYFKRGLKSVLKRLRHGLSLSDIKLLRREFSRV